VLPFFSWPMLRAFTQADKDRAGITSRQVNNWCRGRAVVIGYAGGVTRGDSRQTGRPPFRKRRDAEGVRFALTIGAYAWIVFPCQITYGHVAPMMEFPPSDRPPDCLQRIRTGGGQNRDTVLTTVPNRFPRPKHITEEIERLDRKVAPPVRFLNSRRASSSVGAEPPRGPQSEPPGLQ
jgi:hypothetical protein